MTPPSTIKIGPFRYAVTVDARKPDDCDENCTGHIVTHKQTIWVEANQGSDQMADTLLHEVLHGCWFLSAGSDDGDDEKFIVRVSSVLLGVLRDNPNLVTFLVGD